MSGKGEYKIPLKCVAQKMVTDLYVGTYRRNLFMCTAIRIIISVKKMNINNNRLKPITIKWPTSETSIHMSWKEIDVVYDAVVRTFQDSL